MRKTIALKLFSIITTLFFLLSIFPQGTFASTTLLQLRHEDYTENTITVNVYLDTLGNTIHAVTTNFTYPEDLLLPKDVTAGDLFDSVIDMDISKSGTVYFSAVSSDGFRGQGNVASVKFELLKAGTADLAFTNDVAVIDKQSSENIVGDTEIAQYSIDSLKNLPDTGILEAATSFYGLLMLITMIMIIVFAIVGFSMWGGIYFSIGKLEVKGKYQFGAGRKGTKKHNQKKTKNQKGS